MNGFLIVMLLMLAVMWFLLIRPQRQQQRRHADMLQTLKVGDEIITAGGIYGEVTGVDSDRVMVEIDEDVQVAVAKRSIASVVPPDELRRLEEADEPVSAEADERAVMEDPARR